MSQKVVKHNFIQCKDLHCYLLLKRKISSMKKFLSFKNPTQPCKKVMHTNEKNEKASFLYLKFFFNVDPVTYKLLQPASVDTHNWL